MVQVKVLGLMALIDEGYIFIIFLFFLIVSSYLFFLSKLKITKT